MICPRTILVLFIPALFSCSSPVKEQADLIVHNGVVYTVDSLFNTTEAFAVKDGKIIATGENDSILSHFEAKEMIDAGGNAVYPGFIDAHCHFYGYGENLSQCDLVGTTSFDDVIARLQEYAKTHPEGWLIGRGWDQNDWAVKAFPDNKKLDELFPGRPVYLKRIDGHAALASSKALELAKITTSSHIEGGAIGLATEGSFQMPTGKDVPLLNGKLSGIVMDNAKDSIEKVIPLVPKDKIRSFLLAAQKNCLAVGLTTVDDAGLEKKVIDVMDELHKSGELKMRVYAMLTDNKENLMYYLEHGPYKTERLNVRAFKFYADGALGSRGACLVDDYSDSAGYKGLLLQKPEYFARAANKVREKRFQMCTHCIGDSAVRLMQTIYKYPDLRWRIEHYQVINKNDIGNIHGIIPSVQPTHATSDMYWAKDRLGAERVKYAYAYKGLLDAAGRVALGTDFPVENINPMYTFYAAVGRRDLQGVPANGYQMENALTRVETLRGMTIWAAYANFEEKEKGSLETGKFADFVILDKDIMKIGIDQVPSVKVLSTFVNGEKVFDAVHKKIP